MTYTSAAVETISAENDTEISSDDTASTAIIGGADGPTSIFVTSLPKIMGFAAQLLTLGCVLLALCLAALAAYWALRKRY